MERLSIPLGGGSPPYRGVAAETLVPWGVTPKAICTGPALQQVTDPLAEPACSIGKLIIDLGSAGQTVGSCFYVGGGRFVTAGHCLFFHELGLWAEGVTIVGPSGSETVADAFWTPPAFHAGGYEAQHDYGFLDVAGGDWGEPPFAFKLWTATDSELREKNTFHLCGYPQPPPGLMMKTSGQIKRQEVTPGARTISYTMDTLKGMSGCPLFTTVGGERFVVGIHIRGDCPNVSVRITGDVRQWLNSESPRA